MKKINNLRDALRTHRLAAGLWQAVPCSKEENEYYTRMLNKTGQLPENIIYYKDALGGCIFSTVYKPDLTPDEINEFLTYKKLRMLNTIKNCAVFFTVLAGISLFITLITFLSV